MPTIILVKRPENEGALYFVQFVCLARFFCILGEKQSILNQLMWVLYLSSL